MKAHDVGHFVSLVGRTPTPRRRSLSEPTFTRDEELMHVRVTRRGEKEGTRHRLTGDDSHRGRRPWSVSITNGFTACGTSLADRSVYSSPLEESYEGELCKDGCFTPFEIERANRHNVEAEALRRDAAARDEAEREAERERSFNAMRERVRQARTSETLPIVKTDDDDD